MKSKINSQTSCAKSAQLSDGVFPWAIAERNLA